MSPVLKPNMFFFPTEVKWVLVGWKPLLLGVEAIATRVEAIAIAVEAQSPTESVLHNARICLAEHCGLEVSDHLWEEEAHRG